SRARDLLQVARRVSVPAGQKIVVQGTRGDTFYIIVNGVVSVIQEGRELKTYMAGDYFGETALILGQPRNADVVAKTDVELVTLDRSDFLFLLRGSNIRRRLEHLAKSRLEGIWALLEQNSVLKTLSSAQKTQLESYLEPYAASTGELLWSPNHAP